MKVSTVSQMRELDRKAIETYGIREELLMENAGEAVSSVILREFGAYGRKFTVICGMGNNGGDGFVIARKIHSCGGKVRVFLMGDPSKYRGAARMNFDILRSLPLEVRQVVSADSLRQDLEGCDAVVDAVFGTGLVRNVEGLYREIIETINGSGKTVFSVDIPSGVNGDTGHIMGAAVKADYTVTFGLAKIGNMLFPGYGLCGKLFVTYISLPPEIYDTEAIKVAINRPPKLPPRDRDGHKGSFGQSLFIAGASGYFGAPYFAALSFLRAGGGYSRLAAPASMTPFIANKGSEIVFHPQKETSTGSLSLKNIEHLLALSENMDMVVLGPGISLEEETQGLARALVREIRKPLLLDGDGITALCTDLKLVRERQGKTVLTPHLGEMARITKKTASEIRINRLAVLQETAGNLDAIIVLKGAHSLIGYPDERVFINMSGNSGMATAGSGDVLTGTIAAMYGLGLPLEDAVRKGVFIHGLSGDLAAQQSGEDGITAQDILNALPLAMKTDRQGLDRVLRERYLGPEVV
jgi:NAD(P)H-hydrate epimerase